MPVRSVNGVAECQMLDGRNSTMRIYAGFQFCWDSTKTGGTPLRSREGIATGSKRQTFETEVVMRSADPALPRCGSDVMTTATHNRSAGPALPRCGSDLMTRVSREAVTKSKAHQSSKQSSKHNGQRPILSTILRVPNRAR
jgi:hypothetical protein